MAGETKVVQQLSEEAADELVKGVRQLKSSGKLKKLAKEVGVSTEALEKVASKGTDALEGLSKKLDDLQLGLDSILKRPSKKPPAVSPEFAKEEIAREKGFTLATPPPPQGMEGSRGGPLVRAQTQAVGPELPGNRRFFPNETVDPVTGAPMSTETAVVPYGSVLNKPTMTQEELSKAAAQAKPGQAGRGVSEVTPATKVARGEESRMQAERAADLGLNLDLPEIPGMPKIPKGAKRAGLGLGLAGIASGFSKEANAPTTIAAAQVDKIEDVKGLADKAEAQGAVTPEQKVVFEEQAEQVNKASQSLEKMLLKEYQRDKARVELMQLTETIMNGLVTAIGANALLNRGSPYAVDFSKGPKTDWAGELDRLQKDFKTQMDALNEKYKLEAQEKREAERAARQESQFQQSQALKREAMGIKAKAADTTQAAQEETKRENLQAKLTGTLEKINAPEITPAALISQAGMLNTQARQLLGEAGYAELKKEAAKIAKEDAGIFEKGWNAILSLVGKDVGKETKAEHKRRVQAMATLLAKKLEEGIPTAPAAPAAAAPADADRALLEELRARKAAQQKGG